MVMGGEPAVRPQRGRYPCGACGKRVEVNTIWCQCSKGGATRDVRGLEI